MAIFIDDYNGLTNIKDRHISKGQKGQTIFVTSAGRSDVSG